jgi:transcriptional regulator with XRE-family HTH domain
MTKARGKRPAKRPAEQEFNGILGKRLEVIRRARKITRVALAERIGISDGQLYFWEIGDQRIPPYFLELICRELCVDLAELMRNNTTPRNASKRGMKPDETLLISFAESISCKA